MYVFLLITTHRSMTSSVVRPSFVVSEDHTNGVGPYFADVAYAFVPPLPLVHVNNPKTRWYAVTKGWFVGVFSDA